MYARVARFEGASFDELEREAQDVRGGIEAMRQGNPPPDVPQELAEVVSRVLMLADRELSRSAFVVFCETEADLRRADALLEGMSPTNPGMRRVAVERYEVLLDETTG
jgi:hypothetical protein